MNGLEIGLLCAGVLLVPVAVREIVFEVRHVGHVRRMIRMTEDEAAEWEDRAAMTVPEHRGSMILAAEQAAHHELPWWPAPTADPAPWLEQTRAELSPEALDCPVCKPGQCPGSGPGCYWYYQYPGSGDAAVIPPASSGPDQVWADRNAGRFDSALAGPGSTSLSGEPGPATLAPSRWLAEQLDIQRAWWDWQMEKVRIFA